MAKRNLLVKVCERDGDICNDLPAQYASSPIIIAAGPLFKQPGTVPCRVVIVSHENEFTVYDELFHEDGNHLEFHAASFFTYDRPFSSNNQAEAFALALKCFADRCKTQAEFALSLDRDHHFYAVGTEVQIVSGDWEGDHGVIESDPGSGWETPIRVRIPAPSLCIDGEQYAVGAPVVETFTLAEIRLDSKKLKV